MVMDEMLKKMEQVFQLRAFTSALQLMLMTSDPCHRPYQPLKVKLLYTLVNFTTNNGLQINACKTEVVALSMTNHAPNLTFSVAGHQVGTKQEAKCLRVLVEI